MWSLASSMIGEARQAQAFSGEEALLTSMAKTKSLLSTDASSDRRLCLNYPAWNRDMP